MATNGFRSTQDTQHHSVKAAESISELSNIKRKNIYIYKSKAAGQELIFTYIYLYMIKLEAG